MKKELVWKIIGYSAECILVIGATADLITIRKQRKQIKQLQNEVESVRFENSLLKGVNEIQSNVMESMGEAIDFLTEENESLQGPKKKKA